MPEAQEILRRNGEGREVSLQARLGELVRLRPGPGSSRREGRAVASDLPPRREAEDWKQSMTPDTSPATTLGVSRRGS